MCLQGWLRGWCLEEGQGGEGVERKLGESVAARVCSKKASAQQLLKVQQPDLMVGDRKEQMGCLVGGLFGCACGVAMGVRLQCPLLGETQLHP